MAPFKKFARLASFVAIIAVAFRAIGSFLSWVEKQEDSPADTWVDEEELEEV